MSSNVTHDNNTLLSLLYTSLLWIACVCQQSCDPLVSLLYLFLHYSVLQTFQPKFFFSWRSQAVFFFFPPQSILAATDLVIDKYMCEIVSWTQKFQRIMAYLLPVRKNPLFGGNLNPPECRARHLTKTSRVWGY